VFVLYPDFKPAKYISSDIQKMFRASTLIPADTPTVGTIDDKTGIVSLIRYFVAKNPTYTNSHNGP
jgi:hypothetical protein